MADVTPINPSEIGTAAAMKKTPQPLPDDFDIARMIEEPPPPREYVLNSIERNEGIFPVAECCGIAAPGGTGKSLLILQLAVSTAGGVPFIGQFKPQQPMHVRIFMAEDDEAEVHRRLTDILAAYKAELSPSEYAALIERLQTHLHIKSVRGIDFMLTKHLKGANTYQHGDAMRQIMDLLEPGQDCLVVFDPLRKMTVGEENGESMSAVVKVLDALIRKAHAQKDGAKITPVIVHHSSKESARGGYDDAGAFRGATDLVDGLRFTMVLASITKEDRKDYDLTEEEAAYLRTWSVPKFNYGPRTRKNGLLWKDGVFWRHDLKKSTEAEKEDARRLGLLTAIADHGPVSKFALKRDHKPKECPQRQVDLLLKEMVEAGLVDETDNGKAKGKLYQINDTGREAMAHLGMDIPF